MSTPASEPALDALADRLLDVVPRVARRLRGRHHHGRQDLSGSRLRSLLTVQRHPGIGLTDLSSHLGIGRSAASALVDRLVRDGDLQRQTDPTERRRVQIDLTAAGRRRLRLEQGRTRRDLVARLEVLDRGDRSALVAALAILEALAQDDGPHEEG